MVNDHFGIKLLYPSSESNVQYLALPSTSNELSQGVTFNTKIGNIDGTVTGAASPSGAIAWLEYAPDEGNDVKLLMLPSSLTISENNASIDVDCELNHEEAHNRGYVNDSGEWQNIEMTSHFFIKTVDSAKGYIFFEARNGYDSDKKGGCCQGTSYGVRLFWDTGSDKGKFAFYKQEFTNSLVDLPKQSQTRIPNFYQEWFGAKFVIYNNTTNNRVKLELWLTPVIFFNPAHANSNLWAKVGETEDYVGRDWTNGGDECDAIADDAPITWATPFCGFGWKDGSVIQFMYTSAREIDINGTFGEDPIPDPNPIPDPGVPDPDPDPPTTPDPQPPDAEIPQTPTTLTRRLTIRREVLNNRFCSCDGIQGEDPTTPPDGGGGGGGGGGSGTLLTLYNVPVDTSAFARLASESGSSIYYLRFGQGVTQTNSPWIGKTINRVELTIAKQGSPTGSTGGGVHCRVRKGSDDSIAATLSPVTAESNITTAGTLVVFENLTNTYKLVFNDKLLFEYDGGDSSNYIKIFNTEQPTTTGTKIVWQANTMDPGEYGDEPSVDICARVYTLTP